MKNILEEINSRLGDTEEYLCDQEESWKLSSQKSKIKKDPKQNNPGTLTMLISRFWLYGFYFLFFFLLFPLFTLSVLLLQPEK